MEQVPTELEGMRVQIDDVVYMPSLEAPPDRPHPFVYFISIINDSDQHVVIRGRKWVVREEGGHATVVEGEGVVGQNPELGPGDDFSYNSYHVTATHGVAEGAFFGTTSDGRRVFVRIPSFRLDVPKWA